MSIAHIIQDECHPSRSSMGLSIWVLSYLCSSYHPFHHFVFLSFEVHGFIFNVTPTQLQRVHLGVSSTAEEYHENTGAVTNTVGLFSAFQGYHQYTWKFLV